MTKPNDFLRVFFATDIHGSEICFKKFINAAKFYDAQVLILGGDIMGKAVLPIVRQKDGTYAYWAFGTTRRAQPSELEKVQRIAANLGFYPYVVQRTEFDRLTSDESRRQEIFRELMIRQLKDWIAYAERQLKGTGTKCFVSLGNDDPDYLGEILERSTAIVRPEGKVVSLSDDHEMVSLGYSNTTPWNSFRECSEEELKAWIDKLMSHVEKPESCIFNIHVPPFGSGLDEAEEIDESFGVKTIAGVPVVKPVGSIAVREALEQYQPLLGLFGHVHEGRGYSRIGRTLCLNPGSSYQQAVLQGALIDLADSQVKTFQLTSG